MQRLIQEIREEDATGAIARIYGEIRRDFGVPAVSTIYRHVATVPGCLEWVWSALAPAVSCGDFQVAARSLRRATAIAPLPRVPRVALRAMGVDPEAEAAIFNVCRAYNRSNPLNLLFAFALKTLMAEGPGGGPYTPRTRVWSPPRAFGELVKMVPPEAMDPALAELVAVIGSCGFPPDQRWVPSVYRHLANWPAYLAYAGATLWPRLQSGATARANAAMIDRARIAAAELVQHLPRPGDEFQPPRRDEAEALNTMLDRLIPQIAEMIVVCTLLMHALPPAQRKC